MCVCVCFKSCEYVSADGHNDMLNDLADCRCFGQRSMKHETKLATGKFPSSWPICLMYFIMCFCAASSLEGWLLSSGIQHIRRHMFPVHVVRFHCSLIVPPDLDYFPLAPLLQSSKLAGSLKPKANEIMLRTSETILMTVVIVRSDW